MGVLDRFQVIDRGFVINPETIVTFVVKLGHCWRLLSSALNDLSIRVIGEKVAWKFKISSRSRFDKGCIVACFAHVAANLWINSHAIEKKFMECSCCKPWPSGIGNADVNRSAATIERTAACKSVTGSGKVCANRTYSRTAAVVRK